MILPVSVKDKKCQTTKKKIRQAYEKIEAFEKKEEIKKSEVEACYLYPKKDKNSKSTCIQNYHSICTTTLNKNPQETFFSNAKIVDSLNKQKCACESFKNYKDEPESFICFCNSNINRPLLTNFYNSVCNLEYNKSPFIKICSVNKKQNPENNAVLCTPLKKDLPIIKGIFCKKNKHKNKRRKKRSLSISSTETYTASMYSFLSSEPFTVPTSQTPQVVHANNALNMHFVNFEFNLTYHLNIVKGVLDIFACMVFANTSLTNGTYPLSSKGIIDLILILPFVLGLVMIILVIHVKRKEMIKRRRRSFII